MDETAFPSIMPRIGNRITGSNDVIAKGMTSVIHQVAIIAATANVAVVSGLSGFKYGIG